MLENLINQIAQNQIDFETGCQTILNDTAIDYQEFFNLMKIYIFNAIPDKTNYHSATYEMAVTTIPLKPSFTPIVILKTFSPKIAFKKLEELPKNEHSKTSIALLWIFKELDTERRNTECKNGCKHEWHTIK